MKSLFAGCISIVIILGSCHPLNAQTYSLKITASSFSLDGKKFNGYSTQFTQPYKEVKKAWWKYVNARTIIFNNKTHLVLTVPAKKRESNTSLKYVSQLTEEKNSKRSTLRMALVPDGIAKDQIGDLEKQASDILKDFKVAYFSKLVQEQVEEQELVSKKISLEMDKYLLANGRLQQQIEKKPEENSDFIEKLEANTVDIETLQGRLITTQKKLSRLKKELTLIK